MIRVLLADDHPLIRAGICTTLVAEPDIMVVGEAADGHETQQQTQHLAPDVLLLDVQMPGPSSVETVLFVRQHCPTVKLLTLTAYDDDVYVRSLLAAGITGYVLKDEATQVVVNAVRTVHAGGVWLSQSVAQKLVDWGMQAPLPQDKGVLTAREHEVLRLVVQGKSNSEIGLILGVQEKTIAKHLSSVFAKLNVTTRVEAAVWAVRERLS